MKLIISCIPMLRQAALCYHTVFFLQQLVAELQDKHVKLLVIVHMCVELWTCMHVCKSVSPPEKNIEYFLFFYLSAFLLCEFPSEAL